MADVPELGDHLRMVADTDVLAQLLALGALLAASAEYSHIIRRRAAERRLAADRNMAAQSGLHGLVRVLLQDP